MKNPRTFCLGVLASICALFSLAFVVSCGGGSTTTMNTGGTVNTGLSDPPTCTEFSHVFVTITKVTAHLNANAGPNDSGWQTLVDLTGSPKQVDLLTLNPTATPGFCGTLFMLASSTLPAGTYQQIRFFLLANNAASGPSSNACGSAGFNCVVPTNSSTPAELQLPSEAQTGIKIPSSQITQGGLTVTAGQSVDLNIDFDSCASVVQEGNGQFRLKPVLHAGEVSLNNNSISGKVVEGSGAPNPGQPVPSALVLLEQPATVGSATIDEVVMSGTAKPDGTFAFCPVMGSSNFDVVVAGQTTQTITGITTTTTYNPSVVLGVPVGGGTGSIPLFAETTTGSSTGLVSTNPGTISGQISSTSATSMPVAGSVQISALQAVTSGGSTINLTIPVFQASSTPAGNMSDSQPPTFTTVVAPTSACATATADCVGYSIQVPASAVAVGNFSSSSGNTITAPSSTTQASYTINALADGSNGLLTCSPSAVTSNAVTVMSGTTVNQTNEPSLSFSFTGCTAP